MHARDTITNDRTLLNLRAMNDVERNAQLVSLEQKINGTNNKILTDPGHVHPQSMSWEESSVER